MMPLTLHRIRQSRHLVIRLTPDHDGCQTAILAPLLPVPLWTATPRLEPVVHLGGVTLAVALTQLSVRPIMSLMAVRWEGPSDLDQYHQEISDALNRLFWGF